MSDAPLSRREFLERSALGASAFTVVPRHVLGGPEHTAPSDTVYLGCIGAGGMGGADIDGLSEVEGTEIAVLCDVDEERAADTFAEYPEAARYVDYREMIAREANDLDAVTVSTPDHNHAPASLRAMREGLAVRCQKPLTHTVEEARMMGETARETGVPTAMGIQHHSHDGLRDLRELLEAGVIGTIREVHYTTNRPIWPQAIERPLEAYHVPETMHWDLWLGPAPHRPYHPDYAPFNWRGWYDFGTGALGDIACHAFDGAFWSLQLEAPTRISAETTPLYEETFPAVSRITYEVPSRSSAAASSVRLVWRDGDLHPARPQEWPRGRPWPPEGYGQIFVGDDGIILFGTSRYPEILPASRHEEVMADPPEQRYERTPESYTEFVRAVRGGPPAQANFADYAAPLSELVLLGNLAVRSQDTIEWDDESRTVTNRSDLNEMLSKEHRSGWEVAAS